MENKHCVICGAILVNGICRDRGDHWRYRGPEALQRSIEKLQENLYSTINKRMIDTDPVMEYIDGIRTRRRK